MHIITGMLIAGLMQLKRGEGIGGLNLAGLAKISLLPHLKTGPVRVEHAVPGRLRLRVPSLSDDESGAVRLGERLPGIAGVEAVHIHRETGSVLIHYRGDEVRPELLFAAVVRLLGFEDDIARPPRSLVTRELREMLGAVNRMVYDRTGGVLDLWSAVMILMAGLGVRKMWQSGLTQSLPSGFTLMWWALHSLAKTDPE